MLDLIVALGEINHCRYEPAQGKFVKVVIKSEMESWLRSQAKKKSLAKSEKFPAELEHEVKLVEKHATRSKKGLEYLDQPFYMETVRKFKDRKTCLAEWIPCALDMVEKALEESVVDEQVCGPTTNV